ncbi:hypothetical protein BCR43DRAFT_482931 [Syncephalastrum racemosum]|uniref:Uncharacterized protein n=1 Tax=Syncephalastrum racemosum TaxID=13706 RepID=A0A1X2HVT9_SYNRA|nr:hypothetical protein BCR43DRAFT_482931 [Syncephalastrum racemosum]
MNIKILDKKGRKKLPVASSSSSHSEEDASKPQSTRRRNRPMADKVDETSSLTRNSIWTDSQINDCLSWIAEHREDWRTNRQGSCRAIMKSVSWDRSSRAIHAKIAKLQEDYIRLFSIEKVLNPEYDYYTDQAVAKPVHEDSLSLFNACQGSFGTPTVSEVLELAKQDKKTKSTKGHVESIFQLAPSASNASGRAGPQRKRYATRSATRKAAAESKVNGAQPLKIEQQGVDTTTQKYQKQADEFIRKEASDDHNNNNDSDSSSSSSSSEESESDNYAEDTEGEEDVEEDKESQVSEAERYKAEAPGSLGQDEISDSSSIATPASSVTARESSESAITIPDMYIETPGHSPLASDVHGGQLRLYSNQTSTPKSRHDYPHAISGHHPTLTTHGIMSTADLRRREREVSIEALRLCIDRERLNIALCMRQKDELERQLQSRNQVVMEYENKLQTLLATFE